MKFIRVLVLATLAAFPSTHATAQKASPADMIALEQAYTLAEVNPESALEALDALLDSEIAEDPRLAFELSLMQAELLRDLGEPDAAELFLELAEIAVEERDDNPASRVAADWDPVELLEEAVDIFTAAGDYAAALDTLQIVLEVSQDAGATGDEVGTIYDRMAALADRAGEDADAFRQSAEAARTAEPPTRSADDTEGGYQTVKVFYATDRARTGKKRPHRFYGNGRGALEMGVAEVTVPYSHQASEIEDFSILRLEFGPNPSKHIVLKSVTPVAGEGFFADMNATLAEAGSTEAFVFVHGYNVKFDAAAKRAAQLAVDINFQGVPILYSWPSRGRIGGYFSDAAVVRLSGRRLTTFLEDVVDKSGATTIHLIAHSMGNRAMTDALELLALRRNVADTGQPLFNQIILAAPDVDADLFTEMMPTIRPIAQRITLYANENDWALFTSKSLHGRQPRAGQGGADLLLAEEFDSLDMSVLGDDMLAHSYFAGDSSALADLAALFWRGVAPNARCGLEPEEREGAKVPAWRYIPDACSDTTLVEVIAHLRAQNVQNEADARQVLLRIAKDRSVALRLLPVVRGMLKN